MAERHKRGRDRDENRDARASDPRTSGQDEPWREDWRTRYPAERHGGEREREFGESRRYQRGGWEGSQPGREDWRGQGRRGTDYRRELGPESYGEEPRQAMGHGYGHGFSDSGDYRPERPAGRSWEHDSRSEDRGWGGRTTRDEPESWDRWRGEGSGRDYGGAGFGFGPAEQPGRWDTSGYWSPYGGDPGYGRGEPGRFRDTDWMANRPARGRGTWAGDRGDTRWTGGDWISGRMSGGYGEPYQMGRLGESFAGRGPRDYRRSDDRIREEVCDIFTDDPNLDPSDVVVKVENGDVTLMGTVSSRDQKRRAEAAAERVSGVRDVINQIRVSRPETTTPVPQQPAAPRGSRAASSQERPGVAADRENR